VLITDEIGKTIVIINPFLVKIIDRNPVIGAAPIRCSPACRSAVNSTKPRARIAINSLFIVIPPFL